MKITFANPSLPAQGIVVVTATADDDSELAIYAAFAEEGFATCTQCPSNLNRRNTYLLTRNRTDQELVEAPEYKSGATGMVACVCDEGTFAPRAHVDEDWECTYCPMRESCPGGTPRASAAAARAPPPFCVPPCAASPPRRARARESDP